MRLKSRTRTTNPYSYSGGTAWGTALPANPSRQILLFQNIGTVTANLGFSTAIFIGSGVSVTAYPGLTYGGANASIQLGTSATFLLEQHAGPIYISAASGSALLSLTEFVESGTNAIAPGNSGTFNLGSNKPFVSGT